MALLAAGCSEAPPPKRPATAPPAAAAPLQGDTSPAMIDTSSAPLDATLGKCAVALLAPSQPQEEVIEALRTAYGLEGSLIDRLGAFDTITREDVYAHYRQGFSDQLARELADYSWQPEEKRVRATDRALTVPDSVGVLELKSDRALVAWIPPTNFRRQWGAPRCFIDRLVREEGRWIIQGREP